ncbi:MAG: SufE family protein [Pseudomonadota bacterium]
MSAKSFDEVVEDFEFLEAWEDRYRYVIELGKAMPALEDAKRSRSTKVDGCASQVWLVPEVEGTGPSARIRFEGDSDAMIVRGLIALLTLLYNDRTGAEILAIDAPDAFGRLGLDQHLSAQRSNGLRAMIARIRDIASASQAA